MRGIRIPQHIQKAMIEAYLSGMKMREVGQKFGYSRSSCGEILVRTGVVSRQRQVRKANQDDFNAGVIQCLRCGIKKPMDCFAQARRVKLGRVRCCRDCNSEISGTKRRQKPPERILSESERAYLAGLIDGEGCIGLTKYHSRILRQDRIGCYCARMSIAMTGKELYDFQAEIGVGKIRTQKRQHAHWKDVHVWHMGANACRTILPQVIPYLRFKRQQAILLLEYLNLSAHVAKRDGKAVDDYWVKVDRIREELTALNKRGG